MKNKLYITLLLTSIIISPLVKADDNPEKKRTIEWYLNLGLNMGGSMPVPIPEEVRKIESYNPKINPHVGIGTVYNLNEKWGIGTELSVGSKGMRVTDEVKYMRTKVLVSEEGKPERIAEGYFVGKNMTNVSLYYLSLSVSGVYSISPKWEVKAGIYASSVGKTKFTGNVSDGYLREGTPNGLRVDIEPGNPATFDFSDNMRDFDAGFIIGGKYKVNDRIGVFVDFNCGLTDIFYRDQNPIQFKMQNLYGSFGVSYRLFDFDGVIADTEPQYDIYIDAMGERYNLGIENFALQVKGTTSPDILKKYFSHLSKEERDIVEKELAEFELKMDFPPVSGIMEFISYLKNNNYRIGLVTSSQDFKMKRALSIMDLTGAFDVEVTAARITEGKPNPMCYLLAAKDLNVSPGECIVFEDSFHGIRAGKDAGMYVVGLSTTIPANQLEGKADCVIPDFSDLNKVIDIINRA